MSTLKNKKGHHKRRSTNLKIAITHQTMSAYKLILQYTKMAQTKRKIEELDEEVEQLRTKSRAIMKKRELSQQVYPHINYLRNLVQRQEALLEEERKVIKKRKDNLLNACSVIQHSIAYNKLSNKKVIDAIDSYHADRHHLQTYDRKLKLRQHKMCRQLLHIFPFRRVRD
eukprot:399617_1